MDALAERHDSRFAPLDDARPAVRHLVRASAGHWEVVFGDGGACFVYATRGAAVRAARGAARRQWQARGVRAAVAIEEAGHATILADYGG